MNGIPIGDLVARSHANAVEHGFYETWPDGKTKVHDVNVPEKLALIHSEISEALEAFRVDGVRRRCPHCNGTGKCDHESPGGLCVECKGAGFTEIHQIDGKPEGFVVELADAVIRIGDLCGAFGLDLAAAIELKHAYNTQRAFRHGGKNC